jgi:hypothetical protein
MNSIEKNISEALMVLRAMTRSTGVIHESQIHQLKYWPVFLMKGVKFVLKINQDTKTLVYEMTRKQKIPKGLYLELEKAVHWLLGPEWKTTIKMNGQKIFTGSVKIKEINTFEKRVYSPLIKCIKEYAGQNQFDDPPVRWK